MSLLVQSIATGILVGGLYALIALGLTLIFGVMRIINLFHGELVMLGMFVAFWLWQLFGIDPIASVLLATPALFLVGLLMYRFLIYPIRLAPHMNQALLTMGVSIVLWTSAHVVFGGDYRVVTTPSASTVVRFWVVSTNLHYLISFAAVLAITGILYLFLMHTDIGKAIRATAQDAEIAELMGINVERISMLAFGIGAAAAAASGAMMLPIYTLYPGVGLIFLFKAFVVVILGGMGSVTGAVAGGLILGVVESLGGIYVAPGYQNAIGFLLFIIVLLFRPAGLFGRSRF